MNPQRDTILLLGSVGDRETDARVTTSEDSTIGESGAPVVAIAQRVAGRNDLVDMVTLTIEQMDALTHAWLAWRAQSPSDGGSSAAGRVQRIAMSPGRATGRCPHCGGAIRLMVAVEDITITPAEPE